MLTSRPLQKAGDRHRFQIYSIVFVCLKWMIVSLTVFLPSYLFATPTFTCLQKQFKVSQVNACPRINQCKVDFPGTITAHMGLFCQNKYVRDSILSSEFVGSVSGLILLSILADRLGRKTIIVSTLYLTCMGAIFLTIGASKKILGLLYLGQIMMGFGGFALSMVSYSYLSEINNNLWRQKSLVLTYSFWAIGEIMLYPIIEWIYNWYWILIFVFLLPLVILMGMSAFIVETPEFLYVQGRYDECLQSLNYIAKFNGRPQIQSIDPPLESEQKQAQKITDTFTKRQFLVPLIVLSFAQICNNGIYYATQYSITQLGQSFQINMVIIGALELASCLITNYYCQKMHRKWWIMVFMITCGCIGVIIQFLTQNSTFQLILIAISRLLNTFAFALFSLITTQSFPTSIRSTGTGVSEAMSNLGNMSAPFIVTLGDEIGVKGIFISGLVCIVGGLAMNFVKQTKDSKDKESRNPLLEDQAEEQQQEESSGSKKSSSSEKQVKTSNQV